jgi:parvulin-like peptidyl-prolyl isomerase
MTYKTFTFTLAILLLFVAACNAPLHTPTTAATPTPSPTPTPTPTPVPPTPTPIPLAASVNGEGISLAEYQAEMTRYQAAIGTDLATDWQRRVLNDLIDQTLLAQAAREKGFVLNETDLQTRVDDLAQQAGGSQALTDWMQAHGYSQDEFHHALERSIAAAWMSGQVVDTISWTADQVHARQILLYNSTDASNILFQLNNGADYATLAYQYDPATGGDLGWFPKGYLTEQALEKAAFDLEPGKYSDVIETSLGYHILLVIEHDPQHPLTSDARMTLQEKALSLWLEERRGRSDIQILVP